MKNEKYNSQKALVRAVLKTDKKITRNYCLARHITRLGAIIKDLEYLKWEFKQRGYIGYNKEDYQYLLTKVGK
jgi:hypothetical protein